MALEHLEKFVQLAKGKVDLKPYYYEAKKHLLDAYQIMDTPISQRISLV